MESVWLYVAIFMNIATSQPQAAYSSLTFSIKHKWSYLMRTTKDISASLQPVEDVIRHKVLPAILGKRAINNAERQLFALPGRMGSLGIPILPEIAPLEATNSTKVTTPLMEPILREADDSCVAVEYKQVQGLAPKRMKEDNRQRNKEASSHTIDMLSKSSRRAVILAQQKGASAWLGTLPIVLKNMDSLCIKGHSKTP